MLLIVEKCSEQKSVNFGSTFSEWHGNGYVSSSYSLFEAGNVRQELDVFYIITRPLSAFDETGMR